MKLISFLSFLLFLPLISCGGNGSASAVPDSLDDESGSFLTAGNDITETAWHTADSLLASMDIESKVGQCFMPTIFSRADSLTLARLDTYINDLHVGGVVLLKGDLRGASEMSLRASEASVALFTAIDAEWGLGMRLMDAPDFPRNGRLSPDADEQDLFDYGREVARECRRVGINMVLGPVVDVVENPAGVIGSRSFGGDPVRVADLGVAYARGVESGGVLSVAKHFPGHGSPAGDSHKSLQVIKRSLHQLDSVDLYPFRSYIDAGLSGVMVGHLAVPAIDPEVLPGAVSEVVIKDLLRNELGFKGLVLTDALNMRGVSGYGAKAAILAGADIVIGPADTSAEITDVITAVKNGEIAPGVIDDRCRRILFYKTLLGLGPLPDPDFEKLQVEVDSMSAPVREQLQGLR